MRAEPAGGWATSVARSVASARAAIGSERVASAEAVETVAAKTNATVILRGVIRSVLALRETLY
jgi:hypothetical protein